MERSARTDTACRRGGARCTQPGAWAASCVLAPRGPLQASRAQEGRNAPQTRCGPAVLRLRGAAKGKTSMEWPGAARGGTHAGAHQFGCSPGAALASPHAARMQPACTLHAARMQPACTLHAARMQSPCTPHAAKRPRARRAPCRTCRLRGRPPRAARQRTSPAGTALLTGVGGGRARPGERRGRFSWGEARGRTGQGALGTAAGRRRFAGPATRAPHGPGPDAPARGLLLLPRPHRGAPHQSCGPRRLQAAIL
jgi:hypothetical protein